MYLCNQHTSQMKKLRFFSSESQSVKKRWTIINNKIAIIYYGVHYLLRSVTSMYKDYKLIYVFVGNYYGTPHK